MAFTGVLNRRLTRETQPENGSARSLANAKSCLDEPAVTVIQEAIPSTMFIDTSPVVAAADPVELSRIWI